MLSSLRQDVTYAVRSFSRSPGLVAAIVVSIGLGIGANTTVFSLVNELLLRDVPVRDPGSLYTIRTGRTSSLSYPQYTDFRAATGVFEGLAAHCPIVPTNLAAAGGPPQRVWGQMVSGSYFGLVGVPMLMGRGIVPAEDEVELRNPVLVMGHGLWQRLGADPAILGRTIRLSGTPYTVIGVTAPGFFGTDRGLGPEFWAPLAMRRQLWPDISKDVEVKRTTHWIELTARLKAGVSKQQAAAALNVIAARVAVEQKEKNKPPEPVSLFRAGQIPEAGPLIGILMTALSVVVGLVLLIACANVANLLLARASSRRREMGIRLSIGASRTRVLRQLLTESVLLSLCGSVFGFMIAVPGAMALARIQPPIPLPVRFDFSPDIRVLLFTTALAVFTGILFGIAPAFAATRGNLSDAIRTSGLGAGGTNSGRMTTLLVGVQVTLSLVLLVGSGLFLRSLQSASAIDLGMRPEGVVMMSVDTKGQGYSIERTEQFYRDVNRRFSAIPGVQSVSFTSIAPLSLASSNHFYRDAADPKGKGTSTNEFMVGSRYFETLGIPILAGRDFSDRDLKTPVALINKTMAASLFGKENPLGRHVRTGGGDSVAKLYEVIGVVGDSKAVTLGEERQACIFQYFPSDFSQAISLIGSTIVLRTGSGAGHVLGDVRAAMETIDRDMAVFSVSTMTSHIDKAMMLPRVCAVLFGLFGGVGLILAAVGLYGVVNYSVRTRTREIGIRFALGARPGQIAGEMARTALTVVGIGLLIGLGISFALSRFMTSLLYGVAPTDVVTFAGVPLILLGVSLVAVLLPAHRASRLEPMSALRDE